MWISNLQAGTMMFHQHYVVGGGYNYSRFWYNGLFPIRRQWNACLSWQSLWYQQKPSEIDMNSHTRILSSNMWITILILRILLLVKQLDCCETIVRYLGVSVQVLELITMNVEKLNTKKSCNIGPNFWAKNMRQTMVILWNILDPCYDTYQDEY